MGFFDNSEWLKCARVENQMRVVPETVLPKSRNKLSPDTRNASLISICPLFRISLLDLSAHKHKRGVELCFYDFCKILANRL